CVVREFGREIVVGGLFLVRGGATGRAGWLPGAVWRPAAAAGSVATAEHDQLTGGDLRHVSGVPVLVVVGAVLDLTFEVDAIALLQVLLGDVGEGGPGDDPVPLRLLLLLTALVVPATARGDGEFGDLRTTTCRADIG